MTTLMEEIRQVVRALLRWMGFTSTQETAVAVIPVVVLGVALNVMALGVVNCVRPLSASKTKANVTCLARVELKAIRTASTGALHQIGGGQRALSSAKRWAARRLAEIRAKSGQDCDRQQSMNGFGDSAAAILPGLN